MSSYELDREENIRRNRALIEELGLQRPIEPKSLRRPVRKRRRVADATPRRTSARIASAPKAKYTSPPPPPQNRSSWGRPGKAKHRATFQTSDRVSKGPQSSPPPDLEELVENWTSWTASAPPPQRNEDGTLHFDSHPSFTPNKTPAEVLREGAFGGCYYRPYRSLKLGIVIQGDWRELPTEWIAGLDVSRYLTGGDAGEYDPEVNKYAVKAGQSLEDWERAGWMDHRFDARGWFQWYTRFYMGRRCEDDDRQVGRWERCVGKKGRWRRVLLKQYLTRGVRSVMDEEGGEGGDGGEVSPIVSQTGLQWAWEVKQDELDEVWVKGI